MVDVMAELPEIPRKPKPLLVGVVLAGGVLLYVWWSHRSSVTAATADPSSIDPLTGLAYSAESGTPTGVNAATGAAGLGATVDMAEAGITDAASWTADVVTKLGEVYNPDAIYTAIGDYLASVPLSTAEAGIVRSAWAASGKLPFLPQSYTLATGGSTPGNGGPPVTPGPPPPGPPPKPPTPPHGPPPHVYTKYITVLKYTSVNPPWQSTLSGISAHTGVSVDKLRSINNLSSDTIHPGEKIYYA